MPYYRHENPDLIAAFEREPLPFQGADPAQARCVFFGLDANFDEHIENSKIFSDVLTYLRDGPRFWREKKTHHPFLLDSYTGNGRFYHNSFAQIGFTPDYAGCVSFVELLPFPTFGRSNLTARDMDLKEIQDHLRLLNEIIVCSNQLVFIPTTVGRLLRIASEHFYWIPVQPTHCHDRRLVDLKQWHNDIKDCVYWHYHFSYYGRSNDVKQRQLTEIRKLCINSHK